MLVQDLIYDSARNDHFQLAIIFTSAISGGETFLKVDCFLSRHWSKGKRSFCLNKGYF